MTTRPASKWNRTGAIAMAVAVVASISSLTAPADAQAIVTVSRTSGPDRYATAAAVAIADYAGVARPIGNVILASGEDFPDGLAAASLAGAADAPVLLTSRQTLPPATLMALSELQPELVHVVGGSGAVGASVRAHLTALGYPLHEIAGANRYSTAAEVSEYLRSAVAPIGQFQGRRTAIVATGNDFPDALAGGALAARRRMPILLTGPTLPPETAAELSAANIQQVLILGGTKAVPVAVETAMEAMGLTVLRVNGADRYGTASALADLLTTAAPAGFGFTSENVVLVSGTSFADALTGGPWASRSGPGSPAAGNVVLLAGGQATLAHLQSKSAIVASIRVVGGTATVTSDQVIAARTAATSS